MGLRENGRCELLMIVLLTAAQYRRVRDPSLRSTLRLPPQYPMILDLGHTWRPASPPTELQITNARRSGTKASIKSRNCSLQV